MKEKMKEMKPKKNLMILIKKGKEKENYINKDLIL